MKIRKRWALWKRANPVLQLRLTNDTLAALNYLPPDRRMYYIVKALNYHFRKARHARH